MSKYKNPEIHRAILRGDMARMLAAIDAGMLNARDAECQTPLHWASWRGAGGRYLEFMRALIDAGADIHATDGRGRTPMHLGASVGKSRGVRLLIEQGADVHATDVNEDTPLCTVLGEWYRYAIYALLDNGAEPGNCHDQLADLYLNMCNLDWRDELRLYSYRRSVLAALLRRGLDALYVFDAARGYHLLHALCRYGAPIKDVRLLLDSGAGDGINSLTRAGETALHLHLACAGSPVLGTVRDLLEHGADATIPDGEGRTVIEILHSRYGLNKRRRSSPTSQLTRLL